MHVPSLCCLVSAWACSLVANEAEELYPSPLRNDPRPMDGVVHATYVIARMHYTMERLLESGLLTDEEEREAADWIERNAQGYGEGVVVVERLFVRTCRSDWCAKPGKRPAVCFAKAHTESSQRCSARDPQPRWREARWISEIAGP